MQFMPRPGGILDLMVPARSNDMIVGFPLDIARYAIMAEVVATAVGMRAGRLFMPSANSHIYQNCYGLAEELIGRAAKSECKLLLRHTWALRGFDIDQLYIDDFSIADYDPHKALKVEVN